MVLSNNFEVVSTVLSWSAISRRDARAAKQICPRPGCSQDAAAFSAMLLELLANILCAAWSQRSGGPSAVCLLAVFPEMRHLTAAGRALN